jgi:hypothetical protein
MRYLAFKVSPIIRIIFSIRMVLACLAYAVFYTNPVQLNNKRNFVSPVGITVQMNENYLVG